MSRTTDYILEQEDKGELVYDDSRGEYMSPYRLALLNEIEYLEWEISKSKRQLQEKVRELNNL